LIVAVTDALAKTIEDTKSFVDTSKDKMKKATDLLDENIKTVNQARKDYQEVRKLLDEAKADVIEATKILSDGAHAASSGNLPGLDCCNRTRRSQGDRCRRKIQTGRH
jgi:ABC-type transporter Mla subunit MlaD